MKSRLLFVLLVAAVGATIYAGEVLATSSQGFTGTTLAKATFGEIDSHVVAEPGWQEKIKTQGASDLYVQQNTWDPSACGGCIPSSGWHTHPGPSLVIVTQGTVTEYDGDDPTCTPHVYPQGSTFIDSGGGHVHLLRNESGSQAVTVAVQLVPAGFVRRIDRPNPGYCPNIN